jgi:hypothetical protein
VVCEALPGIHFEVKRTEKGNPYDWVAQADVESVGKSTFAANFPAPLFLDVEGGTAHLDTTRAEIGSAVELDEALAACKGNEYKTIIIDSADWAERLVLEHMLATDKKKSVEDYGYGKGFVMLAEKFARLLGVADQLIAAGKHVVFIAHSKFSASSRPISCRHTIALS